MPIGYFIALDAWLFLTVLFANFATAFAEARGKAQADSLKRARHDTVAYLIAKSGSIEEVSSNDLKPGDRVSVSAGQIIPGDGEVIEGVASVDESAITGESAPVIREAGGDRSGVTGGTFVLSDHIVVEITAGRGESFLDKMIALVEGAIRARSPNEIALALVLSGLTLIFLIVVVALWPMARNAELYMASYLGVRLRAEPRHRRPDSHRPHRLPDSHDDRRAARGDRHRRHGPIASGQHPRQERQGRGTRRRHRRRAPGQDGHDHRRLPARDRPSSRSGNTLWWSYPGSRGWLRSATRRPKARASCSYGEITTSPL